MIMQLTMLDSLVHRLREVAYHDGTKAGGDNNRQVTDAELKLVILKAVATYVGQREIAITQKPKAKATPKAVKKVGKSL